MKRAREVFWIVNYLQDIRADFFAIYHIPDWEVLDGPLWVSLVERLPLYEGALQGRIKLEQEHKSRRDDVDLDYDDDDYYDSDSPYTPGQSMSMAQALSGNSKLHALNEESNQAGWGDLFEMKTG